MQSAESASVRTLLSGIPGLIFGMNTGGLPLTQDPSGTLIAFGLAVLASLGVWLLLRRAGISR